MRLVTFLSLATVFLSVFFFEAVVASQEGGILKRTGGIVTKETVWSTDRQTVQSAKQRCSEFSGRQLEECFAAAMEGLGASAEATSFTRLFGGGVFISKFREAGRVDVAYVKHPFRVNEVAGILLVNGEPQIIDVDDIALLPKEAMEQDRTYSMIKRDYPKATLWPGDRSSKYPLSESADDGGQVFVVPYALRNSCHSCEVLGTAFFAFSFSKEGRLVGMHFLRLEPSAKKMTSKNDSRKEHQQIAFVVMAEEGKEFTIRLGSNRTTGYQWRPAEPLDGRVVKLVRSEYVPFDTAAVGGGGEEIWTFLATGKGDAEITMEYVRLWEKTQSEMGTATIKVSVRPGTLK